MSLDVSFSDQSCTKHFTVCFHSTTGLPEPTSNLTVFSFWQSSLRNFRRSPVNSPLFGFCCSRLCNHFTWHRINIFPSFVGRALSFACHLEFSTQRHCPPRRWRDASKLQSPQWRSGQSCQPGIAAGRGKAGCAEASDRGTSWSEEAWKRWLPMPSFSPHLGLAENLVNIVLAHLVAQPGQHCGQLRDGHHRATVVVKELERVLHRSLDIVHLGVLQRCYNRLALAFRGAAWGEGGEGGGDEFRSKSAAAVEKRMR